MVAYLWPAVPAATQVFTFLVFIGLAELVGLAGGASSRQATASQRRAGCGGRSAKKNKKKQESGRARITTPYDDKHSWKVARFQPPGWMFGLVWTILYAAIGFAAALVFLRFDANSGVWRAGLALWFVQLLFNGVWTPIYFGLYQPGWALADLILTLLASAATAGLFWYEDLVAFILMCVYLAWLVFALVLNAVTVARSDHAAIARNRGYYFASMATAY
jgi:benzodiazapine receptor